MRRYGFYPSPSGAARELREELDPAAHGERSGRAGNERLHDRAELPRAPTRDDDEDELLADELRDGTVQVGLGRRVPSHETLDRTGLEPSGFGRGS